MTEQNWREMGAGPELDRVVAERLNCEVRESRFGKLYVLIDQDGETKTVFLKDYWGTEGWPGKWKPLPHYSTDIREALGLPRGDLYFWELYDDAGGGGDLPYANAILRHRLTGKAVSEAESDGKLALAVVYAWLDAQEAAND